MWRPSWPKILYVLGGLLVIGSGVPTVALLMRSFQASRVTQCEVSYSHRHTLIVRLANGEQVFFTSENLPDVRRCLPVDTIIEKRRGQLGYYIGGRYQPPTLDLVPAVAMLAVGILLLIVRVMFFRRPAGSDG